MTPKEKAREIISEFRNIETQFSYDGGYCFEHTDRRDAETYALIVVNEILHIVGLSSGQIDFWQEVKTEIEKL